MTAVGIEPISSNFSITSPNTVPAAQPEVRVFFLSFSSKSVCALGAHDDGFEFPRRSRCR